MAVAFVEAMQLEGGVQRWAVDGGTAAITRPAVSTGTAWDGFVLRDAQQQVQDAGYEWTYANPSLPGVPFHAAKPAAEDAALMWLVDVGVQGQVPTLLNALYARLGLSASANMRTQVADLAESARRLGFEASGLTASGALNGQTRMLAQNANANAGAGAGPPRWWRQRGERRDAEPRLALPPVQLAELLRPRRRRLGRLQGSARPHRRRLRGPRQPDELARAR